MTNQSITNLFGYLSNEARNAMHAIVGLMEMRVDEPRDPNERANLDICRASADRLLRSIDDVQALFSDEPSTPNASEEFDLQTVLEDVLDLLNVAASDTLSRLVLEVPNGPPITVYEDRRIIELMLTRLLDSALKLTSEGEVRVSLVVDQKGMLLELKPAGSTTLRQLAEWINSDPSEIKLE